MPNRKHGNDHRNVQKAERSPVNWNEAQQKAGRNARWAVTMTKVRITKLSRRVRWEFATFHGPAGGEAVGVIDLLAVRKDFGIPRVGMKRGDELQLLLIQVKGGKSAKPTTEDVDRLRIVARRHRARKCLLATWTKGKQATFYSLRTKPIGGLQGWKKQWKEEEDLNPIFG
jgi:hypothetical protein